MKTKPKKPKVPFWLPLLKEDIKDQITETVKVVVNGKIDKIDEKLTKHIEADKVWKEQQEIWMKEDVQPIVDTRKSFMLSGRVAKATVGFLALVGGLLWTLVLLKDKLFK